MKVLSITYRRGGLGTALQKAIHAGVDAMPLPAKTKAAIKGCGGCGRRVVAINAAEERIRQMIRATKPKSPPPDFGKEILTLPE